MVKGSVVAGASIVAVAILLFGMGEFLQPEIENVQDEIIIEQKEKISELQDERIIEQKEKISELQDERIIEEGGKISELQDQSPQSVKTTPSQDCSGKARCFTGKVTDVIDGDTIRVGAQSIRFSLASTPELNEFGGLDAKQFVERICPVGSDALVDEDDGQTEGSYGRIVAVIYCNGINLNEAVIEQGFGTVDTRFCDKSEFKNEEWTGCSVKIIEDSCDPSYPDFCIPSPPPDLDCKDIPQKRFTVIGSDPHRFDGDKDGIGCES